MKLPLRLFQTLAVTSFALVASACGGGSNPQLLGPVGPTATPSPLPAQHLFVGYTVSAPGPTLSIAEYSLPLSSSSNPIATIPSNGQAAAFAVDSMRGTIAEAVSINGAPEVVQLFQPPLTPASTPFVTIPSGAGTIPGTVGLPILGMAFDPLGNLWVATTQDLREFVPPFASYSIAVAIIPNAVLSSPLSSFAAAQPVFDQNGVMFVNSQSQYAGVFSFAPPNYSAPPKRANPPFQFGPLAFDGTGHAIAPYAYNALQTPGPLGTPPPITGIGVYTLPLSSQSLPSTVASLPGGAFSPLSSLVSDAVGGIGNVYVANASDGSLFVYQLPINATDLPIARVPCSSQIAACNGVAIQSLLLQLAP